MFDESDVLWNSAEPFDRRAAWIDLCQLACWRPRTKLIDGDLVRLERGQLLASERFLAKRWRWHRSKVTRFLLLLKRLQRIEQEPNHPASQHGAIITLTKYDTYNPLRASDRTTREASGEPAASQRRAKEEEEEEVRGDKSPLAGRRKGTAYTPEFEAAWDHYPKRDGDNPKTRAFRAWNGSLSRGATPEQMATATRNFAADMQAKGKVGTEYLMQAARFYGPDEPWREYLTPRASRPASAGNPMIAPYRPLTPEELEAQKRPTKNLVDFQQRKREREEREVA